MTFALNFLKGFVLKYLTTVVIEKSIIILLKEAVNRSDSKLDDELYEAVFGKTK